RRRTVGHFRHAFDWLWRAKQLDGARWRVARQFRLAAIIGFGFSPSMQGRDEAEGPFWNMRVARKGDENAVLSKPRRKSVDQLAEPCLVFLILVEARLALGHRRAAQRCQPDHIDAETGIKRV